MKTLKNIRQNKYIVFTLTALIIAIMLCFCTFECIVNAEEVNQNLKFEKLDLQKELESIENFDWINFPPVSQTKKITPSIYKVIEYCYSYYANQQSNYGLYIYMYNPSQINILEKGKSFITLATKHKVVDNAQIATDYEKFELKFISKTDGAYNNLFYKFKVVDHKVNGLSMYERVNKINRQYDISEIELQEQNTLNSNLLCKGGQFNFTGYSKGYGFNNEEKSTLKTTQSALEVLELELNHTYFRTQTSSFGKGYQNQLDAVYFTVPNTVLEKYGELKRIKASWYEYKTSPIVTITEKLYYDNIFPKIGIKQTDPLKAWAFGIDFVENGTTMVADCVWGYGAPSKINASKFKSDFLTYVYYCDKKDIKDWRLKGEDLKRYIYAYDKSYHTGKISMPNSNISNDLFDKNVDAGHTRGYNQKIFDTDQSKDYFNLLDYKSNHSGWDLFKDYFFSYPKDEAYNNVSPIMQIKSTDMLLTNEEISKKYLVEPTDVDDFKKYVTSTNDMVFKFNFGFSQYESNKVGKTVTSISNNNTYTDVGVMSQETVYLNFDIIYLEFKNDLGYHLIPVASLPIDAIADITTPPWLQDNLLDKILQYIMLVLGIILIVILIIVCWPIIKLVIKAIVWIICLPFKAIGSLFKGGKKDKQTVNVVVSSAPTSGKTKKRKVSQNEIELAKKRFNKKE